MTSMLHICPAVPQATANQMRRENVPADSWKDFYQTEFVMPLLDNLTSEIKFYFDPFLQKECKVLVLIYTNDTDTRNLINLYQGNLPDIEVVDQELKIWKMSYAWYLPGDSPTAFASTVKEYDKLKFLNFILLKMGCKLPEILMNTNELSRLLEDWELACTLACKL